MSEETTYSLEFAKSNRSKCKKCKEQINKGDIRIQSSNQNDEFTMVSNYHPTCFNKPRKYADLDDFMENGLVDATGGDILPSKYDELKEQLAYKKPKKKASEVENPLADIKELFESQSEDNPTKKQKNEKVEAYAKYHKTKLDELKDVLRWNRQVLKGIKNVVLFKVVDGTVHGRLSLCQLCGGKLKVTDDCQGVACSGTFDEEAQLRMPCEFKCSLEAAPRWKWFSEEPSQEEEAEMDKQEADAKGQDTGPDIDSKELGTIQTEAAKIDWDLSSRPTIRASADALTELLVQHGLDNPTTKEVGKMISNNRQESLSTIVDMCVKHFGYAEQKAAKAAKKQEHTKNAVKCEANANIVAAFRELAELYAKTGNRNAASTYFRVTNALSELDFEITEENALGLGKGKTKVENIGKATAEKMLEFVTTGTMQKLEDKRVEASD